jgi:hypothetical protein
VRLFAVTCGRCGAPLDVPTDAASITCEYCRAPLLIERRDGVPTSTVADHASPPPPGAAAEPRSPELDRLDQQWLRERQQFMIRGREGELRVPNRPAAIAGAAMTTLLGLFVMQRADETRFKILAGVFVALAVVTGAIAFLRAHRFDKARETYRARRRELLSQLAR